jgi:hypothetical protein
MTCSEGTMMIDCDSCAARGPACGDCVVTFLLGAPPVERPGDGATVIDLDGSEQAALAALAGSGLVPPLRLVATSQPRDGHGARCSCDDRASGRENHSGDDRPGNQRRAAI